MNYKTIEENSAFRVGKEYGKFIAAQITSTPTKKREFYMYKNKVFINDCYVTFNIIELDRDAEKITVNICCQGHHTIDTFELKDLDGWTYFEYGRPVPEKIYIDDFMEIKTLLGDMFKFEVNNGDILTNPLANVIVPKYDENHGEAITYEEEKYIVDLLIESRDKYVQAYVFLAYTGMRIGELASAKPENGWVSLTSEKVRFGLKDKIRHVPVSPMLARVLPYIDVELITSFKKDVLIRHIKTYLPDRTTKDLRHTFITRCRECKIQREITSVWSGHISDNSMTTKVYTHLESNKELQLEEIAMFNYEL